MAKRSSKPALYELMQDRVGRFRATQAPERDDGVRHEPIEGEPLLRWLSPGRAIQMPVGYLLLGSGAILVLLVAAYIVGYSRGSADAERESMHLLAAGADGFNSASGREMDPLLTTARTDGGAAAGRGGGGDAAGRGSSRPGRAAAPSDPGGWGDIHSDPRRPQRWYYVLMTTRPDGADRLARFCRERGLETYSVRINNSSRMVIALPGLESADQTVPEAQQLRVRIAEIGRAWKATGEASDLSDAFPLLYTGR